MHASSYVLLVIFPSIMIMTRLQRFLKSRQLHTIISQETIKPSSPTPHHFKTHNLSLVDLLAPKVHTPLVFLFKNYNNGDLNVLKKSLSLTLTQYYPLAGRFPSPSATHIDCNDEGVEFLVASNDSTVDEFVLKKEQDETLKQLIPNALGCAVNKTSPIMVQVQLNRFACGGAALALSISHKLGDGFTVFNFINHWATLARGGSPVNPCFFSSSRSNIKVPEFASEGTHKVKYVTKRLTFHNSKLNELKNIVNGSGTIPINPTRVEVLSSLLYKCAVSAATTVSGSFQTSTLCQVVNMRKKIIPIILEITGGNILSVVIAKMTNSDEIELHKVIAKLRKQFMGVKEVRDVEEVGEMCAKALLMLHADKTRNYSFSSVCRLPFYEVDFGWGKLDQVLIHKDIDDDGIHLFDSPCGDGIEATVHLREEDMNVFRKDREILAYAQDL